MNAETCEEVGVEEYQAVEETDNNRKELSKLAKMMSAEGLGPMVVGAISAEDETGICLSEASVGYMVPLCLRDVVVLEETSTKACWTRCPSLKG